MEATQCAFIQPLAAFVLSDVPDPLSFLFQKSSMQEQIILHRLTFGVLHCCPWAQFGVSFCAVLSKLYVCGNKVSGVIETCASRNDDAPESKQCQPWGFGRGNGRQRSIGQRHPWGYCRVRWRSSWRCAWLLVPKFSKSLNTARNFTPPALARVNKFAIKTRNEV